LAQTVPTTVFGLTVGFFAFFGLTISALSLAMVITPAKQPTLIGTVSLASKAVPTNAKDHITPSTLELKG
jgi:hypothetical protein